MLSEISQGEYLRIKEVLASALEIAPEGRADFLDKECAGDERLRKEVAKMLAASDEGGKFLEDFSAVSILQNSLNSDDNFLGRKIDNYLIEKEIGRGGMGVVFLATREDFHQQAAIKLIKRGMDSDAILERFQREREILAALNHPYIARLTDGGTTDEGLPFFVMEYVEGVPVDEYCRAHELSEKETLELFRRICEAVAFAHQKLVVHRDLKPSNILVTADGTPKLLDFGIAKLLTSDAQETQTGQRALTPAYASPEQIRGETVDTTSDVYSLGKILNELLPSERGKTAAPATAPNKNKITGKSHPQLTTDLQAVLQTALREETARRYNSVEKFADDLRRYQNGLPVSARRDTFLYRTGKFVSRNKTAVSASVLFLLLAVIGLTAIIREHNKAERRFADVRALANSFLFEFQSAIEDLPGATPARKLVVDRALEYLDKLDVESSGDSSLQRELATAYEKVGQIQGNSYYSNLGDTDGALKSYRRSLEIRQKLAGADGGNPDLQKELSNSYEGLGDMAQTANELPDALQNYQDALAVREKIAALNSDNLKYQAALGDIYSKIGDVEGLEGVPNLGNTPGALENYQKAVAVGEKLVGAAPDNLKYKMDYAQRLSNLGSLDRVVGKTADSIEACRKANEIYRTVVAANPNDFENKFNLLANNAVLRYSLVDDERYEEAVNLINQTITILEGMQAADPKNIIVRRSLGVSYNALSRTLVPMGNFALAEENSRKALKIAEDSANDDAASAEKSADLANTLQFLADVQFHQKDYGTALLTYRRAAAIHQKNLEADPSNIRTHGDLSTCLAGIGETEAAQGKFEEALKDFGQVIPQTEEAAQKSPVNAILRSRLGLRYLEFGEIYEQLSKSSADKRPENQAEAKKWFQKSFDIWSGMQHEGILNKADTDRLREIKN